MSQELLSALLKAENALAKSLPSERTQTALQAHIEALWAVQDLIRGISQPS